MRRPDYTQRHGSVRIEAGDGSRWLQELQQEQDMPVENRRVDHRMSAQRQSLPATTRNNDHTRWERHPEFGGCQAVVVGLVLGGLFLWGILSLPMPV